MIRRILVPLEGSVFTEAATRHACDIARRTGATVFGKAVIDESKPIWGSAPPHALAAQYAAVTRFADLKEERLRIKKALELFAKTCTEAGVAHEEARLQGVPAGMVLEQSIFYDLVVTGFEGDYGVTEQGDEKSVGNLLGNTITPFLIVPRNYREIKDVLVCFDGSFASMRSLQDFAVVASVSQFKITVLTAGKAGKECEFLLKRASEYLQSYGVDDCQIAPPEPVSIRDAVRDSYGKGVDLIVVGAHSRQAVRDFFVGSLVTDLLERADTPVFLGQ